MTARAAAKQFPGNDWQSVDKDNVLRLVRLAEKLECRDRVEWKGPVRVGVDLGTANVVIAVLDADNTPIAARSQYAHVVRDGIVVDFLGAARLLREMKTELEDMLGRTINRAACAIPPGVHPGSVRIIRNTLEAAGFDVDDVLNEPEAAALALGVRDGAVVDVGGGTTGISVLKNGKSVFSADEATGGTHMTLVLAGAYGLPYEEAERYKLEHGHERDIYTAICPVVEKMAAIVDGCIRNRQVGPVFVVGGACSFDEFERTFEACLQLPVIKPPYPLLVTPLGIAMSCKEY